MSHENVDLVYRMYAAWNRGDTEEGVRDVHEDFELHHVGGISDLVGEEFDGREGLLRFWRDLVETVGGRVRIERVLDMGERAVVVGDLEIVGTKSGTPTSQRFGQIWTFREGKVIRVDSYYHAKDALEAAGVRE